MHAGFKNKKLSFHLFKTSIRTLVEYGNCSEQVASDYIKLTVTLAKDACKEFW